MCPLSVPICDCKIESSIFLFVVVFGHNHYIWDSGSLFISLLICNREFYFITRCYSLLSDGGINTMIQVTWWGEIWFHLTGYSSSLRKARAGSRAGQELQSERTWCRNVGGMLLPGSLQVHFQLLFLILVNASCLRTLSLPEDWAHVYKLVIKKMCPHVSLITAIPHPRFLHCSLVKTTKKD